MVAKVFALPYLVTLVLIVVAILRAIDPDSGVGQSRLLRWSVAAAQVFLGLIIFTGGMGKLMPFVGVMGPVWLEEELSKHSLGLFARFIAWSEALIGLLLLTRRFAVLGAIMLVPLLANMLMITISMNWQGTPIVLGFFCLLNVLLLAYRFDAWKSVLFGVSDLNPSAAGMVANAQRNLALTSTGMAMCLCTPFVFLAAGALSYVVVILGFSLILLGEFSRKSLMPAENKSAAGS